SLSSLSLHDALPISLPRPEWWVSVSGKLSSTNPPFWISISKAIRSSPRLAPIPRLGLFSHHLRICSGSVVPSCAPLPPAFLEIWGILVPGRKGKTFQPDSARSSAACKVWLVVGCFSVLIGGSPNWTARPPTPLGPGVLL